MALVNHPEILPAELPQANHNKLTTD